MAARTLASGDILNFSCGQKTIAIINNITLPDGKLNAVVTVLPLINVSGTTIDGGNEITLDGGSSSRLIYALGTATIANILHFNHSLTKSLNAQSCCSS